MDTLWSLHGSEVRTGHNIVFSINTSKHQHEIGNVKTVRKWKCFHIEKCCMSWPSLQWTLYCFSCNKQKLYEIINFVVLINNKRVAVVILQPVQLQTIGEDIIACIVDDCCFCVDVVDVNNCCCVDVVGEEAVTQKNWRIFVWQLLLMTDASVVVLMLL